MKNSYTLTLSPNEICNLMRACTHIVIDSKREQRDPDTDETRREILDSTIRMWQTLHDNLKNQLDEQDASPA